ncbi:hypothetical protein J2S13_003013 [Oikeobacillus pervagus]|uniref:Lipoprotein n=1 Tax=Oikeobacillus pervagus TaxID=1325931 RepID=A0AAJ1T4N3_9BACI|nr:DUF6612 family protein [Oikeobacillus pervagus]MDQ0216551.1 hypothetical protein [Oikeobacillus pervagus]
MRKFLHIMPVISLLFLMTACSQITSKTPKAEEKNMTASFIFNRSIEKLKNINSFHSEMKLTQKADTNPTVSKETISTSSMDVNIEPFAVFQDMKRTETVGEQSSTFSSKVYWTKAGLFYFDQNQSKWFKVQKEIADQFISIPENQKNLSLQLEQLKAHVDDMKVTENDTHYTLSLTSEKQSLDPFLKDFLTSTFPTGPKKIDNEMLKLFSFEDVVLDIQFDKQSFLPTKIFISLNIIHKGAKAKIYQEIESTYSEFNKVLSIEVPDNILNHAIKLQ